MARDVRVLYVVAFPRSGTTVLGDTLGEIEGMVHVGEMLQMWKRPRPLDARWFRTGAKPDRSEGAPRDSRRKHVGEDPVWSPAWERIQRVYADHARRLGLGNGNLDPEVVSSWHASAMRPFRGIRSLRSARAGIRRGDAEARAYVDLIVETYASLARASGAKVIVDTSKLCDCGAFLSTLPGIDPRFVHLVRDPRGVVYSRQRKMRIERPGRATSLDRGYAVLDALRWSKTNATAIGLRRRLEDRISRCVRYEEFAAEPRKVVGSLAAFAGLPKARLPFDDERTVRMGESHAVGGNWNKVRTGPIEIREDERWKHELGAFDRRLIALCASPMFGHFDYAIR